MKRTKDGLLYNPAHAEANSKGGMFSLQVNNRFDLKPGTASKFSPLHSLIQQSETVYKNEQGVVDNGATPNY